MEYLVKVDIFSVQNISWGAKALHSDLPSPLVQVKVQDEQKETRHVDNTSSATFNYHFTFTVRLRQTEFESAAAEVRVMHFGSFGLSYDFLGKMTFGLKRIYAEPRHWKPKEWFLVCDPENPSDARGFVRMSVGVFGPGDEIPSGQVADEELQETMGRSLRSRIVSAPAFNTKNLCILNFVVHKGDAIRKVGRLSKISAPCVTVSFNAVSKTTKVQANVLAPMWNESIRVPVLLPCWDCMVLVELKHRVGNNDTLVGTCHLEFSHIANEALPPTWLNYYCVPEAEGILSSFTGGSEAEPSVFAGRVLVSAAIERSMNPIAGVGPSSETVRDPVTDDSVLWIDFYEVCFEAETPPDEAKVEVSFGSIEEWSEVAPCKSGSFIWDGDAGRMQEISLYLPADYMCYNLIISVHTRQGWGSWQKLMFTRIPVRTFKNLWNEKPKWKDMFSLEGAGQTCGYLLAQLCCGERCAAPERAARVEYKLKPYMFRSFFYQAVNLPISDPDGLSDPYVKVALGSGIGFTCVVKQCLMPVWYEALEFEVMLPSNESLRPDVTVDVLDQDVLNHDSLGTFRYPTNWRDAVPKEWPWLPEWFDLDPPEDHPWAQGKILASFEMVPRREKSEYPFFSNIRPQEHSCRVELFLIGCRLTHQALLSINPMVQIAYGRQDEDLSLPKKLKQTKQGNGGGGQFNFLEEITMNIKLPMDPHFQEWLEVKLLDDGGAGWSFGNGEASECAFAYIHLNPYLTWIDPMDQEKWQQQFLTKTKEQLTEEKAQKEFLATKTAVMQASADQQTRRTSAIKNLLLSSSDNSRDLEQEEKKLEMGIGNRFGLDCNESTNTRLLAKYDYLHLMDETDVMSSGSDGESQNSNQDTAGFVPMSRTLSLTHAFKDIEERVIPENYKNTAEAQDFKKKFRWPVKSADAAQDRPELPHGLERNFPKQALPYDCVPLFRGNTWGEAMTLGFLKFCCRVVVRSKKKKEVDDLDESDELWVRTLQRLRQEYEDARELVLRVYILSVDALIPKSGAGDISTYIWVKNAEAPVGSQYNLKDTANVRHKTLTPEYNKCYILDQCKMPENATLSISVMESRALSDGMEIGRTTIDIEDRWFHPTYRETIRSSMKFKSIPIETRHLHTQDSNISQGNLKLWVEIMTAQNANAHPIDILQSPEPEEFQLRFVIWRTKDVAPPDGEDATNVQVTGQMQLDSGEALRQETDVHYGSIDETATFNWRFLFNVLIPCQDASIKLQVLSKSSLTNMGGETLCEVCLDLATDFVEARRTKSVVELPKTYVQLMHPAKNGIRGQAEVEMKLVPHDEAFQYPVGEGRKEPNQDPWLDPDDPHIVEHRNALANTAIARAAADVVEGVQAGAKMMLYAYVAAGVVACIVGLIILFKFV